MNPQDEHQSPSREARPEGEKRAWTSPRLVVYGDLRRLTLARARSGKDAGTKSGSNFSL